MPLLHMRDVGELVSYVARPCWLLMRGVLGGLTLRSEEVVDEGFGGLTLRFCGCVCCVVALLNVERQRVEVGERAALLDVGCWGGCSFSCR